MCLLLCCVCRVNLNCKPRVSRATINCGETQVTLQPLRNPRQMNEGTANGLTALDFHLYLIPVLSESVVPELLGDSCARQPTRDTRH